MFLYTQDTGHSGSDDNLTINVAPLYEFLSGNRNFQGPNANKIGYEFPSLIGGSGGFGKTRTVFQDQFGIRFPSLNIGLTGNGLDDINYFTPYTAPSEDPDRWKKYDGLAEYGSCCYCTDVDDGNFEGACTDYITKLMNNICKLMKCLIGFFFFIFFIVHPYHVGNSNSFKILFN